MNRVLVTGASGFIGRALVAALAAAGYRIRAAMRRPERTSDQIESVALPDLSAPIDWAPLLDGCDAVIHLAGIAHVGPQIAHANYERVIRTATADLARSAAAARIGHFIYMSSIRAQSGPFADHVLSESDAPKPTDSYGRAKLAAEAAVTSAGLPYTTLRPVLVYGPGAKGNLATLMRLSRLPFSFASFTNRRSLLARDNLIAAIRFALETQAARNQTYIVADPVAPTLAEMVRDMRAARGGGRVLVPIPASLIRAGLSALGRRDLWDRVAGDLVVDPGKLIAAGWRPVIATTAGLASMVRGAATA